MIKNIIVYIACTGCCTAHFYQGHVTTHFFRIPIKTNTVTNLNVSRVHHRVDGEHVGLKGPRVSSSTCLWNNPLLLWPQFETHDAPEADNLRCERCDDPGEFVGLPLAIFSESPVHVVLSKLGLIPFEKFKAWMTKQDLCLCKHYSEQWTTNLDSLTKNQLCIFLLPVVLAVFPRHQWWAYHRAGLEWALDSDLWQQIRWSLQKFVEMSLEENHSGLNINMLLYPRTMKKTCLFWSRICSKWNSKANQTLKIPDDKRCFFSVLFEYQKSWWNIILLVPGLPYRDATHRWTCTLDHVGFYNHRWLPFSHESMGSVKKWAPNFERKRLILEIHPFETHGFHESFPRIHGRSRVVVIPSGKGQPHIPYRSLLHNSSFTLKADGTQSDDPASETGSHPMDSGGEAGPNLQGHVHFLYQSIEDCETRHFTECDGS